VPTRKSQVLTDQLIQETKELLRANNANPSLDTAEVYVFMAEIGRIMRNSNPSNQITTLSELRKMSERLLESGEPAEIAKGLLVSGFAIGWLNPETLMRGGKKG
jgi:hypothetical protein